MDDDSYGTDITLTLAGELASKLSRQIDLIAASSSVSATTTTSRINHDNDDDDDSQEEDDYEDLVNTGDNDDNDTPVLTSASSSEDDDADSTGTSAIDEAASSLASNPAMLNLQSALSKLRSNPMPTSYNKLRESVESAWRSEMELHQAQTVFTATKTSATSPTSMADNLIWTVNAHLTVSSYCAVLENLLDQAEKVKQEELYWQSVEGRDRYSSMYLVQTMPVRIARSLRVLIDRLQYLASSPRPPSRLLSYAAVKRALPPSLLLTSLFPHLSASAHSLLSSQSPNTSTSSAAGGASASTTSTIKRPHLRNRSLLFLTLSPLLLTRQEVSLKRKELKNLRLDLASKIGRLVRDAEKGLQGLSELQQQRRGGSDRKLKDLGGIMAERIAFLDSTLAFSAPVTPVKETPLMEATAEEDNEEAKAIAYEPREPNELLLCLQQTVHKPIASHSALINSRLLSLSRPSRLTRAWPWLLTIPLGSYLLITQLYNSRLTLYSYYTYTIETVEGFIKDWLISPTTQIIETLRHRDDNGLSIMGKESLKSDFDSLERMVVDFVKDQEGGKLSLGELESVGRNVRKGDLSAVLGAYEQDLKSPFKSAITGTLVRTLLIQVQKVKVDVDLAMDGIEKMLQSQQLTFAFVGVAPSMVLLYFVSSWLKSALSVGESSASKDYRRKVWYTLRNIDRLLTSSLDSKSSSLSDQSTGQLLIELTTLRKYANSPAFPTRDRSIRGAFLQDVRDLEKDRGIRSRLRVFDRLMRVWERYIRV